MQKKELARDMVDNPAQAIPSQRKQRKTHSPRTTEYSVLSSIYMEKAMAPHSSTLAWRIPWAEEPGGLQSVGMLGV